MHRYTRMVWAFMVALVFAAAATAAPKGLSQVEAEQLVKGNTAEGTNRWKKNMTWYFAGSGELRKRDDRGNKGKAKWSINNKGELCFQDKHMKSPECGAIVPRADGGYDVFLEGQWNWKKVAPGNPHKL
jgi:hypothetical protein